MKFIFSLLVFLPGSFAFADQCEWTTDKAVKAAKRLLDDNNEIIQWCQNCDEKRPSVIKKVTRVGSHKVGDGDYRAIGVQLEFDTAKEIELDLAYTYVRTGSTIFTNLAQLVGCPSTGAITFIQTTQGVKKIPFWVDRDGVRHDLSESNEDKEAYSSGPLGSHSAEKTRKPAAKKK